MMELFRGSPIVALFAAFIVTLAATPLVRALAWRMNALAHPDARRLHPEPIAQWGGLAIFFGVAFAALLWRQPSADDFRQLAASSTPSDILAAKQTVHLSAAFFGCGFLMLLLGMADDRFELKPLWKFLGQISIIVILWSLGVRIQTLPFSSGTQPLSDPLSLLFTLVWVLGLVNAMNFIDGVDGLASGIAAIGAASLACIEVGKAPWAAAVAASIAGASFGFLRWNFPPAKIFLGDAGSLLLGFWLAMVALTAASKTAAATTLLLPMLVLGVPLFDVMWAIARRAIARKPIWRADRGHLHHRLLARGYTARKVLVVLYSISIALGAMAVAITKLR
jgi:UDP-GlcNAc:undecaprenyl-phosphate GlcNAc-1-phosphate transferase